MTTPITVVDSFTDRPFSGNPAAVCVLDRPAPEPWMQSVAAEMNLSETAFVTRREDGDHDLRWFTPTTEVDLCGHATLASAHVIGGACRFHTRSGLLSCRSAADAGIEMDFPTIPVGDVSTRPSDCAPAIGTAADRILGVYGGTGWLLVELATADDVRAAVSSSPAVVELGGYLIVTAAGDERSASDCVCRVFAPGAGIEEDPVTGSAHCALAPFWAERLGRKDLVGQQLSARGGTVGMSLDGERVVLTGQAVTVSEVQLLVDPPTG